jgi:hypothetical protein
VVDPAGTSIRHGGEEVAIAATADPEYYLYFGGKSSRRP